MKYSAYTNQKYNTFGGVMVYFGFHILGQGEEYGREFLYGLGEYLEDEDAPCDQIVLQSFIYDRKFRIDFKLKGVKVGYVAFDIDRNDILKITTNHYDIPQYEDKLHSCVKDWVEIYNENLFYEKLNECKLTTNDNEITIVYYNDYKKTETTKTLTGTLDKIFDTYTSMNDTLRYCNGEYWRFMNENVSEFYKFFTSFHKDYFLLNAVKRGCIID